MGIKDILNAGKIKRENEGLKELMTPKMQDAATLNAHIAEMEEKRQKLQKECDRLTAKVNVLKEDAVFFEDAIAFQDFGLYTPRYNFLTAEEYKLRLDQIRDQ